MKRLLLSIAVILSLGFCGCEQKPIRGTIVKKNHRDAHTQTSIISNGHATVCISSLCPEQWEVELQEDDTSGWFGRHVVVVPHDRWECLKVGDFYQHVEVK
jgi:hypothetical protein